MFIIGTTLSFISGLIILGYTSIIVHNLSKTARIKFPITNAIMKGRPEWKKIQIKEKKQIYSDGYKHDNKFIHWYYDIVKFEYKYIGDNKLKRVYTKSVEPEGTKGEHKRNRNKSRILCDSTNV